MASRTIGGLAVLTLALVGLTASPATAATRPVNLTVAHETTTVIKPNQAAAVAGDFSGTAEGIALTGGPLFTLPVATSNGDGTFHYTEGSVGTFAQWAHAPGVTVVSGDFNGDGRTDFALLGFNGWTTIPVAMSTGDGTFTITNVSNPTFAGWASSPGAKVIVGDFNGDGRTDIALAGVSGWTTIPVATSNGDGSFTVTNTTSTAFSGWAQISGAKIVTGDFNGDGRTDIALTGVSGWTTIPLAMSNGDGSFTVTNTTSTSFAGWASSTGAKVVVGDFNGDGRADLALTGVSGWTTVPMAFSNGDGSFNVTNDSSPTFAGWAALSNEKPVVGDFNGDGKADIALTGVSGWTTIPTAFSDGDGTFNVTNQTVATFPGLASAPDAEVVLGDFNHDGRTDLAVVGGFNANGVSVALSNGDGSFTEKFDTSSADVTFAKEAEPALGATGTSFPLHEADGCVGAGSYEDELSPGNPGSGNVTHFIHVDNGSCTSSSNLFQLNSSGDLQIVTNFGTVTFEIQYDGPNSGATDRFHFVDTADTSDCLAVGGNFNDTIAEEEPVTDMNGNTTEQEVEQEETIGDVMTLAGCDFTHPTSQDFWTH